MLTTNRFLFSYYLLVIVWAPIPLGSNRVWSWSLLTVLIYVLVILILIQVLSTRTSTNQFRVICEYRWIIAIFAAHLLYLLFQCLPFPSAWVTHLSPDKIAWHQLSPILPERDFIPLTASVHSSITEFYKQLAFYLFFCISLILVNSRLRLLITLGMMVLVCVLEAIYGVTARLMGSEFTFWRPTDGTLAGGTYVNKNHFASLLCMGIGVVIGLTLYIYSSKTFTPSAAKHWRKRLLQLTVSIFGSVGYMLGLLLILLTGVALSQSRGAIVALVVATGFMLILGVTRFGCSSVEARMSPFIFLVAVVAFFAVGGAKLIDSFVNLFASDSSRITHWGQMLSMVSDHWLVGVGNGAFQYTFTHYKYGDYAYYLVDYAHNDHLQLLAEQGIIGSMIWYVAICYCSAVMFSAYQLKRSIRRYQRLLMGIMLACLTFFAHAFVDFTFHIPANALWFYTLLSLGMVISNRLHQLRW